MKKEEFVLLGSKFINRRDNEESVDKYFGNIVSSIAIKNKLTLKLTSNYQSLIAGFKERIIESNSKEQYITLGKDLEEILMAEIQVINETHNISGVWLIDKIEWKNGGIV